MVTYLVRLLLSLSILISSGYSVIYASIDSDNIIDSIGGSFETAIGIYNTHQHPLSFTASKEHGNEIFTVNNSKIEEEDKDFASSSSFLNCHYLNALHLNRIYGFLFQDLPEDLHYSKFVPDTRSLRLHVVIQVFRI
ncbi:hypothetical protein [Algoriphagus persicinus]|uniref:hypothetical protein n=1 Tax=Algoriphagus persicinus TaxID=3108754 RepID=UPI002B36A4DE|nr:hypothetical protein [Algoriphagus sp. E1-3-M2]MEB2786309.1 hypothetical protein [Algoriphagus sp. E1-3-M2]